MWAKENQVYFSSMAGFAFFCCYNRQSACELFFLCKRGYQFGKKLDIAVFPMIQIPASHFHAGQNSKKT